MNFDLKKHTILFTIAGSRAYGLDTPSSDVDTKGIAIPPKEYCLGYLNNFEQADKASHMMKFYEHLTDEEKQKADEGELEGSIYDIRKAFKLLSACNPNMLDPLFCRDDEIRFITPLGQKIRDNRGLFLSTKLNFTLRGYSFAQLKRIRLHRNHLLNPPQKPPERHEYGLTDRKLIPMEQIQAAENLIKKQLDDWEIDYTGLDQATIIYIQEQLEKYMLELKLSTEEDRYVAAAKTLGYNNNFIELMIQERKYRTDKLQWKQYQEWKKNRNPARAKMEAKFGYDCYTDDTEFLTDDGWKLFDDIDIEKHNLATVYIGKDFFHRKFGRVEYQKAKDKFDGKFNGNLYNLYGHHLNTLVTPNHRMLIRKSERKSGKKSNWELCEVSNLPDTFDVFMAPEPNKKNYSNEKFFKDIGLKPEAYLRLLGWFLSDGTFQFNKNKSEKKLKALVVSQKKGGRLCQCMTKFVNNYKDSMNCSLYKYKREVNQFRKKEMTEYILNIRNKDLLNKIFNDCGHAKNKHIPRWVFSLSKRLKKILLDAMILGDGTVRKCGFNSIIYYSVLPRLADDVQELALGCGYETSLYGPYKPTGVYQVHINKTAKSYKTLNRAKNIKKEYVENKRIVCFTVPNGTLITRRNGHIGIHGNSKHASHLVRLIRMCREALELGHIQIYRDDADELLSIRNGAWTYDELMEFVEKEEKELDELYKTSCLPKYPDRNKLDKLCVEIIEEFYETL